MKGFICLLALLCALHNQGLTQQNATYTDSIYITETERKKPAKVLHAEPLYIDLIRDLGARKGEKEWNVGMGLTDNNKYDSYTALVEYEWAPVDRLGLEVELPFTFYYPGKRGGATPGSKLNSLKLAAQYSFFVSEKNKASMALGYIQEIELTEFKQYGRHNLFTGNAYNPFFIAAKRWHNNFHTLLYTGPVFYKERESNLHTLWQINSSLHYMIPGTRNFIGVELNKQLDKPNGFDMTIRPQMRVAITNNVMVGIVTGVPISRSTERLSSFLRFIYEPAHHK